MRVVFFGTPDFAVPTLRALLDHPQEFEVVAAVSQPDRPQGRGQKIVPTPVKVLAESAGIPVWQPQRLRHDPDTLAHLAATQADVFVVVAYGQLLSPQVLALPRLGCINVHGSLLPRYRGAAPIQWAMANGERETGITTMLMDAGMDTGDMLLKATVAIQPEWTAADLTDTLAIMGSQLLLETLRRLGTGQISPIPQDASQATYAPLLKPEHFLLDWRKTAQQLHDQIRGFYPHCWTPWQSQRLKILATQIGDPAQTSPDAPPGTIVALRKGQGFYLQTGGDPLLVTLVHPPSKKPQSAWDFVNGARLQVGDQLGIPVPPLP